MNFFPTASYFKESYIESIEEIISMELKAITMNYSNIESANNAQNENNSCVSSGHNSPQLKDCNLALFVGYLRLILGSYMRDKKDEYIYFVENHDLEGYVSRLIDPMGQRAGEFEISVLSKALGFKISVYDATTPAILCNEYGEGQEIAILFTHDHFEPLYN
jgi:Peptidase C65 Otubain